ncbi:hypothetical protein TSUD_327520 [Trifolium subterraneum]|uniref:Uncharacterized protein n=1 Tax=Trifolium subterraneum TaxID=3900 RepID=A0A2Z6NLN4_TRISU|nr:hypothetical protein TSUD_327520 [Trifolium subterraneum]
MGLKEKMFQLCGEVIGMDFSEEWTVESYVEYLIGVVGKFEFMESVVVIVGYFLVVGKKIMILMVETWGTKI